MSNDRATQITNAIIQAVDKMQPMDAKEKQKTAEAVTAFLPLYDLVIGMVVGDIISEFLPHYYAGAALQGMMANPDEEHDYTEVARNACNYADSMLKARKQ